MRAKYQNLTDTSRNVVDLNSKDDQLSTRMASEMKLVLDKAAKISDWDARPLQQIQVDYAANTSMALLDMFQMGFDKES